MIYSPKNPSILAIDFGSDTVKVVMGEHSPQEKSLVVRSYGTAPSSSCVSQGWITNNLVAIECLGEAIKSAGLYKSSYKSFPQTAIIGFEHPDCETTFVEISKEFKRSEEITETHIKDLKAEIYSKIQKSYKQNSLFTDIATYEWFCDEEEVTSPLTMKVKKITLRAYIVTVKELLISNHSFCVGNILPIDILKKVLHIYTPIASIISTVPSSERPLGTLIMDFGRHITSLVIIRKERIIYSTSIEFGIETVLIRIANGLKLDNLEISKRLLFTYGVSDDILDKIKLVLNGDPLNISNYDFYKILNLIPTSSNQILLPNEITTIPKSEVEFVITITIFELFHKLYYSYLYNKNLIGEFNRVYLIGGGALIPNITSLVENVFRYLKHPKTVKIGNPINIQQLPPTLNTPLFTPVLGLLQYSYLNNLQSQKSKTLLSTIKSFFPSFIQNIFF